MVMHQMKIKKGEFEPRSLSVKRGDTIQFQLADREDSAHVSVAGELFDGENRFEVGPGGKQQAIRGNCGVATYRVSMTLSASFEEPVMEQEQSGTVNGTILVIP
jgi:plastocyanin